MRIKDSYIHSNKSIIRDIAICDNGLTVTRADPDKTSYNINLSSNFVDLTSTLNITGLKSFGTVNITNLTVTNTIQGKAATADALATPRTIWGLSFDGSNDVNGLFTSNVTTGTAPFVIASTTRVNNLNVLYLNGKTDIGANGVIKQVRILNQITTNTDEWVKIAQSPVGDSSIILAIKSAWDNTSNFFVIVKIFTRAKGSNYGEGLNAGKSYNIYTLYSTVNQNLLNKIRVYSNTLTQLFEVWFNIGGKWNLYDVKVLLEDTAANWTLYPVSVTAANSPYTPPEEYSYKSPSTTYLALTESTGVKLDAGATEQTVKNSIGSLANGSIEIWRAVNSGFAMIGFANGSTKTKLGMIGFNSANNLIFRSTNNGDSKIWHAGNDGSGSGLDADLLDGLHGSYYATVASLADYLKLDGGAAEQTVKSSISTLNKGVINLWRNSGDNYTFLGFSNGTTETYLGGIGFQSQSNKSLYRRILDNNNAAVYYKIWDSGNHGSGSGLNADLLDGLHGSYYATAESLTESLADYLPLAGGTMTGTIKRYYGTASDNPMIALTSHNQDIWLWRINSVSTVSTSTSAVYGFGLKYIGSGSQVNNYLNLYADNLNSTTQYLALSINQSGQVGIKGNPNTAYSLYVSGALGVTEDLRVKGKDLYLGTASGAQCHIQYDDTNNCINFIFD